MKANIKRKDTGLLLIQLGVWGAIILIPPLVTLFTTRSTSSATTFLRMLWFIFLSGMRSGTAGRLRIRPER